MKYIGLFTCLCLLSCGVPSKYSNSFVDKTIEIEKLKSDNEAIVIFGDKAYIGFVNINIPSDSVAIKDIGNSKSKQNIIKIKTGRYILDTGLFKRVKRHCLNELHMDFAIFIPGIRVPHDQFIEPMLNDETPAVFYFDVLPGEVIYIGNIDYKSTNCNIVLDNYFEDIVGNIKKDHPEISAHLKEKILKIAKKPDACNFLIEDINNLNNKTYKICLDQLKLLP